MTIYNYKMEEVNGLIYALQIPDNKASVFQAHNI